MTILKSGLTEEEAIAEETRLRPEPNIGLNIAEGGGLPPVRAGHVKSDRETQLRSESVKRAWARNYDERLVAIRKANKDPELRSTRSENAKKQHEAGKLGNKGSKHRRVDCPDCGKSVSIACMWRHKCQ